jgi:hypothetical protein
MKQAVMLAVVVWFGVAASCSVQAQARLPLRLLAPTDTAGLSRVLARPAYYKLQISFVRVRRDAQGIPHLSRPMHYRLRPREYFYPVSAVKLARKAGPLTPYYPLSHGRFAYAHRLSFRRAN